MDKRSSWQIQKAVFFALFIRELQTRFGRYRLGYFWALIEPLSHILVLSVLFSVIRERNIFFNVPFPLFFATGVLSFFLFQKLVLTSVNSIRVNMGLFGYRQVKPFDAIIVRCMLEAAVGICTMLALAFIGGWIFNFQVIPADPLGALLVLVILIIFGVGVGLVVAVIGGISEELSQFVPSIMRPLYFLSGVFFPLEAIPEQFQHYLLWNPMLHGVEQFRIAFIEDYPSGNTSLYYVALWAIFSLFFGLILYRNNAARVMTR